MLRYTSKKIKHYKHFKCFNEDIFISFYYYNENNLIKIYHNLKADKNFTEGRQAIHSFNKPKRNIYDLTLKKIKNKFRYIHEWNEFKNELRKTIYYNYPKTWDIVLPDKIAIWASRELQKLQQKYGDNCTDNYRVAKLGNTIQEKRYRRQRNNGCCGFFDCIVVCPIDGKAYRLGFNYGH